MQDSFQTRHDGYHSTMSQELRFYEAFSSVQRVIPHCVVAIDQLTAIAEEIESRVVAVWRKLRIPLRKYDTDRPHEFVDMHDVPTWASPLLESQLFGWDPFLASRSSESLQMPRIIQSVESRKISSYLSELSDWLQVRLDYVQKHVEGRANRVSLIVTATVHLLSRVRLCRKELFGLMDRVRRMSRLAGLAEWDYEPIAVIVPTVSDPIFDEFCLIGVDPFNASLDVEIPEEPNYLDGSREVRMVAIRPLLTVIVCHSHL